MVVATRDAEGLPRFDDPSAAEAALLKAKEDTLGVFLEERGESLTLDFSPESLKRLEAWYIQAGCPASGRAGYSLPHAIGFYWGEVLCKAHGFTWIVVECPFQRGRYEIGIKRQQLSLMLTKGRLPSLDGNRRMQSLWREYRRHVR